MTRNVSKPKRVPVMVFAGEFWPGASGLGLADGFRKLGWAVQQIDRSRYFFNHGTSLLQRALRRASLEVGTAAFQAAIVEACEVLEPDVFLSIKGTELGSEQLRRIKATGARTALFYPDFHFEHRGVALASFAEFDHIFTTKTFHVDFLGQRFGAHRVHYVPHGYSSSVHFPLYGELSDGEYEVDYQHVGLASAHKAGQLAALKAAQPNSSMRLVGAYWEKFCTGTPLAASLGGPSQTGTAYSRLLQTARINVAVLMGSDKTGWADKVSTRSFEIPASRGFMLHEDNDEIREFFEPGAEIDVFSSIHELIEKSGFYLARPDLRARMIERAHARCVPAYSYDARAEQIHKTLRDGK